MSQEIHFRKKTKPNVRMCMSGLVQGKTKTKSGLLQLPNLSIFNNFVKKKYYKHAR